MGNLGVPELLIIAGVIILLFGARKLPEMARSLGKSAKAFKEETKGLRGEDEDKDKPAAQQPVQQQLPQAQPPTPQAQPQTNGVTPQSVEQQNKTN
ncbi:Sec-independent protein translocase subunit TatA [Actinophytocola sp.]|uniref:Sec-independent protein translocase subunit TatA n=1 Tax=Actinophytocola sp. TaxID=1872138 RepID=UPI002ED34A86